MRAGLIVEVEWDWYDLGVKNGTEAKKMLALQLFDLGNMILKSNHQESALTLEDDVTGKRLGRIVFRARSKPEAGSE
jgi:metal-dependent HD superfamily phosphatase/phosphodiesterase